MCCSCIVSYVKPIIRFDILILPSVIFCIDQLYIRSKSGLKCNRIPWNLRHQKNQHPFQCKCHGKFSAESLLHRPPTWSWARLGHTYSKNQSLIIFWYKRLFAYRYKSSKCNGITAPPFKIISLHLKMFYRYPKPAEPPQKSTPTKGLAMNFFQC